MSSNITINSRRTRLAHLVSLSVTREEGFITLSRYQVEMTGLADEPLFPFPDFSLDGCFGERWSDRDPGLCGERREPEVDVVKLFILFHH